MAGRNLVETFDSLTLPARLGAAGETLEHYTLIRGLDDSGEEAETVLADLLCDLMHFARASGLAAGAFTDALELATMHFESEKNDEENGENHCEE